MGSHCGRAGIPQRSRDIAVALGQSSGRHRRGTWQRSTGLLPLGRDGSTNGAIMVGKLATLPFSLLAYCTRLDFRSNRHLQVASSFLYFKAIRTVTSFVSLYKY